MYRFQSPDLNYMNMDESGFAVKFAPFVNERNVFDIMEELAKAERHITQNVNAKMVFFRSFVTPDGSDKTVSKNYSENPVSTVTNRESVTVDCRIINKA